VGVSHKKAGEGEGAPSSSHARHLLVVALPVTLPVTIVVVVVLAVVAVAVVVAALSLAAIEEWW